MKTIVLSRKERRRRERSETKYQQRGREGEATQLPARRRWRLAQIALLLCFTAAVATALISSGRTGPAAAPSPGLALTEDNTIVQIFLGGQNPPPEILQVAKATADWNRGKLNPKGTEMWVPPSQEFWLPNRKATVRAVHLQAGDKLLQNDGTLLTCAGTAVRPIISDEEFAKLYSRVHGEDASVPMGEPGMNLSKVTRTFQNKVSEVYQVFYGSSNPPRDMSPQTVSSKELEALSHEVNEGDGGSVFVTAEHPYYVLNKAKFVPVKALEAGDLFRDFKGNELVFHGARRFMAKPDDPFTVYNFEVANQHTYFAGKEGVLVHNMCSAGVQKYASVFETLLKKPQAIFDTATEELLALLKNDRALAETDYIDAVSYATLRKANQGAHMPRPMPWRDQHNYVPDPRLVEEAKAHRVEKGLLTREGMNRNVAVAKVKVNGETKFLAEANQPFADGSGSLHSEEALGIRIDRLRQQGNTVTVEELFTERIPCNEVGGCKKVIARQMEGANVFFWTTGNAGKSKVEDLISIYGL
jgi:hypothetical protein